MDSPEFANPFDHSSTPVEPERGAVIAYQRLGQRGVVLDFVSFRAGNGRWYTTGRTSPQSVDWPELCAFLRGAFGPIKISTQWAELAFTAPLAIDQGWAEAEAAVRTLYAARRSASSDDGTPDAWPSQS